jgi:hypothetical protein
VKLWRLILLPAALGGLSQAQAQSNRVVRFTVSKDDLTPSAIYRQPPKGPAVPARDGLRLDIPPGQRARVFLVYRFNGSQYLPPSIEIELNLKVESGASELEFPIPFRRWKRCGSVAVEGISRYSTALTPSLVQAFLEARLLLAFRRDTDAECDDLTDDVQAIMAVRRPRLPVFIQFPN